MSHLLTWAARAPQAGEFWEVGVHRGLSATVLAQMAPGVLRLFDTFAGRPEAGPEDHPCSTSRFADTSLAFVRRRVLEAQPDAQIVYHVGTVPETFAGTEDAQVAFAYVDLDLYAPTRAAIAWIWPRLVPGGILLVDDCCGTICASAWPGVAKAVATFPALPWRQDQQRMVAIHA
jgi:predicted O-methyltransferase YrrM